MVSEVVPLVIAEGVRSNSDEDGTTILHITENKIYSLMGIGSQIWQQLLLSKAGLLPTELVRKLKTEYTEVPLDQIENDVTSILASLRRQNLVELVADSNRANYRNRFLSTTTRNVMVPSIRCCLTLHLTVLAVLLLLLFVDLSLKLGRFNLLYTIVQTWPVSNCSIASQTYEHVLDDIASGLAIYPKQAQCLQRSAVATCLLRSCGFPAHMVIGCQRHPFLMHAWTELEGKVVNDRPTVRQTHHFIDRV